MRIVGIDPGITGALALFANTMVVAIADTPLLAIAVMPDKPANSHIAVACEACAEGAARGEGLMALAIRHWKKQWPNAAFVYDRGVGRA
jgi:hypothetical protein